MGGKPCHFLRCCPEWQAVNVLGSIQGLLSKLLLSVVFPADSAQHQDVPLPLHQLPPMLPPGPILVLQPVMVAAALQTVPRVTLVPASPPAAVVECGPPPPAPVSQQVSRKRSESPTRDSNLRIPADEVKLFLVLVSGSLLIVLLG
jgi:hypothetical protein